MQDKEEFAKAVITKRLACVIDTPVNNKDNVVILNQREKGLRNERSVFAMRRNFDMSK